MNKLIYPLILFNLSCGMQNNCNLYSCNKKQYIPEGPKNELIKRDYYNYVINNSKIIHFADYLVNKDYYVAGVSSNLECCCSIAVALKDEYSRDRKDLEIANTLVHESSHCESKSGDESYAEQKEKEFLTKEVK